MVPIDGMATMPDLDLSGKPGPYITVLRTSAALRFLPGHQLQLLFGVADEPFLVTLRTRYLPFGGEPEAIPRELWVEVSGPGNDLTDAIAKAVQAASTCVGLLCVAMNAATELLTVEIAFDGADEHEMHEFFQNFLVDESGLPRLARLVRAEPFVEFFNQLIVHERADRLLMATFQYEIALRYFLPGRESLALAHLYMAMEALTVIVREREIERYGGRQALLDAWGIEPKRCRDCSAQIGVGDLDAQIRRRILLGGDDEVYRDAKKASDGLEHGFLSGAEINRYATRHLEQLARLVRHAILDLVSHTATWRDSLLDENLDLAVPSTRASKYVRCELIGPTLKLARPDEQYPHFVLESSIKSITTNENDELVVFPEDRITPVVGEDVEVGNFTFEIWGVKPDSEGSVAAPESDEASGPVDVNQAPFEPGVAP